jgi:PIN domain nuclease of toxin-antitoxin system
MVDPENIVLVSAVSFWEISLKCALGKIEIKGASPEDLPGVARAMGFDLLPLDSETASTFFKLPREEHRDPFDRMLVWQAIRAELTLVTKDPGMAAYADQGLALLW